MRIYNGYRVRKKPARIVKRRTRNPEKPGPRSPGSAKRTGRQTPPAKTIPGKPKARLWQIKPARTAVATPAPRKFGTRREIHRKP